MLTEAYASEFVLAGDKEEQEALGQALEARVLCSPSVVQVERDRELEGALPHLGVTPGSAVCRVRTATGHIIVIAMPDRIVPHKARQREKIAGLPFVTVSAAWVMQQPHLDNALMVRESISYRPSAR